MIHKVSFYGYFFCESADCIVRYDILWKRLDKYLLKSTTLDLEFRNPTEEIVVMVYNNLKACVAGIVGNFRNRELEQRLYRRLKPVIELHSLYRPLIDEIADFISGNNITCFSIFGNPKKYRSRTQANEILKQMGYFILTTKRPHIYVLEDYIREECRLLQNGISAQSGSRS